MQQLGSSGLGAGGSGSEDEDQPVVVELTDEERRMAGLEL